MNSDYIFCATSHEPFLELARQLRSAGIRYEQVTANVPLRHIGDYRMSGDTYAIMLPCGFVPEFGGEADVRRPPRSSLAAIVEQLASCDYRCEAGPLVNNSAFFELRDGARDEGCLAENAPCGDCAWCRMFGGGK